MRPCELNIYCPYCDRHSRVDTRHWCEAYPGGPRDIGLSRAAADGIIVDSYENEEKREEA